MKDTIINLTPPIDGVQYGISDEPIKEGDWMWNQWKGTFEGCFGIAGKTWHKSMKKVICSTNPKDLRFPFLVMPSKEQKVDLSFAIWYSGMEKAKVQSAYKRFVKETGYINPAKYTQEQMEKAYNHAMWACGDTGHGQSFNEYIQSLQPTVKAVRVEMENNQCDGCIAGIPVDENGSHRMGQGTYPDFMGCQKNKYNKIKIEQSTKHPQGIVRAIEVIY